MHSDHHKTNSSAVILKFSRKRGRPRSAIKTIDLGTPELIQKRRMGETSETLDLCLEMRLISTKQHWCGVHLRWLFTLRYGAPNVRAIDPTHTKGMDIKTDDPQWRIKREKEYHDALKEITRSGHALLLMNICIYNERPKLLSGHTASQCELKELKHKLQEGLDVLDNLWGKQSKRG